MASLLPQISKTEQETRPEMPTHGRKTSEATMTTDTLNIAHRCHKPTTAQRLEIDWYLAGAWALLAFMVVAFSYLAVTAPMPEAPITIISVR